jgi:hypothetical protein
MELLRISHDPVRRETIFSDISKTPLTHEIWTELLLHLGRVNHNLVTRGGSRPLTTSAVPQAVKPPDPRAIPIKQADIFRPVVKKPTTFGLSLLDGPVVRAVPPEPVMRATQATMQIEGKAVEKAKKLQSEVVGRIEATPTGHTALGEAAGWIDAVYGWVGGEWARRSVERSLPDPDVFRLIVDSTCSPRFHFSG